MAVSAPAAEGLYDTVSVHDAPTASEVTVVQVPDARNSAALLLLRVMPVAFAAPVLVTVTDCDALVAGTVTEPNASDAGAAVSAGAEAGQVGAKKIQSEMSSISVVVSASVSRRPGHVGHGVQRRFDVGGIGALA